MKRMRLIKSWIDPLPADNVKALCAQFVSDAKELAGDKPDYGMAFGYIMGHAWFWQASGDDADAHDALKEVHQAALRAVARMSERGIKDKATRVRLSIKGNATKKEKAERLKRKVEAVWRREWAKGKINSQAIVEEVKAACDCSERIAYTHKPKKVTAKR